MAERITPDQFRTVSVAGTSELDSETRGFSAKGQAIDPNDPKCLAKSVPLHESRGTNCFAVVSTVGGRRLFDPMTDDPAQLGAKDSSGFPKWKHERVPTEVFHAYTAFLKNRNVALLRQANRGL